MLSANHCVRGRGIRALLQEENEGSNRRASFQYIKKEKKVASPPPKGDLEFDLTPLPLL